MEQQIRFCTTIDGVRIAFSTVGKGPFLVIPPGWVSHIQLQWEHPAAREYLEMGTRSQTFVFYDKHGCGLSERNRTEFTLESEIRPLESVVDHLKLKRFALFGFSQGGPISIAYAISHPRRVSHLILYDAYANGEAITTEEFKASFCSLIRSAWGVGSKTLADIFLPGVDASATEWFKRLQREATTAEMAAKLLDLTYRLNVTELLPRLRVPTLVIHRKGDKAIPFHLGREMASMIPNSRFVPLEGGIHIPFFGDSIAVLRITGEFLGVPVDKAPPEQFHTPDETGEKKEMIDREAHGLIASLDEVVLSRYSVVGNYSRYEETINNSLKDIKQKIIEGFERPIRKRKNHLIWGPPGTGKTYFVEQIAGASSVVYHEFNLAKFNEQEFDSCLSKISNIEKPSLCFIDEIDAKSMESWPYEHLLPHLDVAVESAAPLVFVFAGSSGSSLAEMKEKIASRPKGPDLLSRIPNENEHVISPMTIGDRMIVVLNQFRQAGKEVGREVRAVEKIGLYYIALNPKLLNARQLREFAIHGVERMPFGEERIKYDHLFSAGDPENKAFWMKTLPLADDLVKRYVSLED